MSSSTHHVGDRFYVVTIAQQIGGREEQQDAYAVRSLPDGLLLVVADGMGGLKRGREVATDACAELPPAFASAFARTGSARRAFAAGFAHAQSVVIGHLGGQNGGCALTGAYVSSRGVCFAHLGDVLGTLHGSAGPRHETAFHRMAPHVLSRYVGTSGGGPPDVSPWFSVSPGDRILLASDGVHETCARSDLGRLARDPDVLVRQAVRRPDADNATILVCEEAHAGSWARD